MVVSAFAVPALVAEVGWRTGWFVLGALGMAATVAALPALARAPEVAAHAAHRRPTFGMHAARGLHAVLASYVLFGAGYIAYTTFIVAYLRSNLGFGADEVTLFWGCVGLAATGAGLAWGPLLARLVRRARRRRGECRGGGGCDPAGADRDAAGGVCIGRTVRRLVPDRADLGHRVRAQGGAAARMDGGDRGADCRICILASASGRG